MNKFVKLSCTITVFLLVCAVSFAQAHYLWLNVDDHRPRVKSIPMFSVGWGHHFYSPVGDILTRPELLETLQLIDPAGKSSELTLVDGFKYQAHQRYSAGTYLATVAIKERFSTKTDKGYLSQPKTGLTNVLSSRYLGMYGKAIINVGTGGDSTSLSQPVGTSLELVPLSNPADLRVGDSFRFRLLYQGQPLAEEIKATYAGFSPHNAWPYTCRTNREGEGAIRILAPGIWVIKVNHRAPYKNSEEADEYSYTATLNFEIR
ncbi:DUF4198 domain-containing protein [Desulfobulbus rhabdoformis]|uniref:DUF4198 domain-containing protein n=1 Tax=Desulfobulbus rhabdoformis TaxID=34032 RepID=UPI0019637B45|nr:DUF4198 domain-containing protein [Desulfobulbus rhabdoformis]MBM9616131.1 DUF4198 domain-containing protein [Desulfobulbus rhabdoformis]